MMNQKLKEKVDFLIDGIPNLVKNFNEWGYRKGPDLYFYKRTLSEIRKNKLKDLLENKNFIELIYATLVSWDMNSRGAKMEYFDQFFDNISKNSKDFLELTKYELNTIPQEQLSTVMSELSNLYSKLKLMKSGGRLVSNSKIMHFILPKLVMPMDGQNTLMFFYGNTGESKKKFLEIFECSWNIAKDLDLELYLDNEWNQTIPKIIDNAILFKMTKDS